MHRFALALLFLQGIAVARGALFPAARRQHCALYATERATPTPPEPARVLISAFSELDQVPPPFPPVLTGRASSLLPY